MVSLLAGFVVLKQWINRCINIPFTNWPSHLFIESLPLALQSSLILLICGLCRYTWTFNPLVSGLLIGFTVAGMMFYIIIVIAGVCSYESPFHTPTSITVRFFWHGHPLSDRRIPCRRCGFVPEIVRSAPSVAGCSMPNTPCTALVAIDPNGVSFSHFVSPDRAAPSPTIPSPTAADPTSTNLILTFTPTSRPRHNSDQASKEKR